MYIHGRVAANLRTHHKLGLKPSSLHRQSNCTQRTNSFCFSEQSCWSFACWDIASETEISVFFVVNTVFGDKQCCQEDLHCGGDCESGFSRHPEAHGLCGVLQRCLVGSHWNCSLSLLPLAGISTCNVFTGLLFHTLLHLHVKSPWHRSLLLSLKHLGPSALAGIATVILIFPLNGFIAKKRSKLQVKCWYRSPSHFGSSCLDIWHVQVRMPQLV